MTQFIIVGLTVASINGSHSIENLVLSGLLNNLHIIATSKLWGGEMDAIDYIPVLSHLSLPPLDLQVYVTSNGSSFSLAKCSRNSLLYSFWGSSSWYISRRLSIEKDPMTCCLLFLKVLSKMSTSSITHFTISMYGIVFGLTAIRHKNEHVVSK